MKVANLHDHPAARSADARVLVVDDNEIALELTAMMAQRLGVEADGAADGNQALRMIERAAARGRPYSLVLMDFIMPAVDGFEATRRLRQQGHAAGELPVIALTACAEPQEIDRFTAAGGQGYLSKPLNADRLAAVFDVWLPETAKPVRQQATGSSDMLRERYHQRKHDTIRRIAEAVSQGRADAVTIAEIRNLLHKLAGTAGLFGDEQLSEVAAECEVALIGAAPAATLEVLEYSRNRLGGAH